MDCRQDVVHIPLRHASEEWQPTSRSATELRTGQPAGCGSTETSSRWGLVEREVVEHRPDAVAAAVTQQVLLRLMSWA